MSISNGLLQTGSSGADVEEIAAPTSQALELLRRGFGVEFNVIDGESGQPVHVSSEEPQRDWRPREELCRQVATRSGPEFIEEEGPLLVMGLPLPQVNNHVDVAAATFVTRKVAADEDLSQEAVLLGMDPHETARWASRQAVWEPGMIERVGRLVLDQMAAKLRIEALEDEARNISVNLAATYEEISLLYWITQNLKISESDEDLGQAALEWMEEVVPAQGLAIRLTPVTDEHELLTHPGRTESKLLSVGECPLNDEQFGRLVDHLGLEAANQPTVVNYPATTDPSWPFPQVREMIAVPLAEGENLFGWLAAFNHVSKEEFGTVEASLMSSVGTILGIHSGNLDLYRQQSELLAGIVQALTWAIDAKDPYTCGHSDRVARVSVQLARQLGCDRETADRIYLSGLLHDIGKIGIDDSVLRKPGRLTDEEYEHIKTHVNVGYKILRDLKKLDDVLPVVLYHHESWDGSGYPGRLAGEDIPRPARIVAVADAFDAMSSDRPYRKGMPDEKIDEIFRAGSGSQWDPEVVEAFFQSRNSIREITKTEQSEADIGLHNWV